MKRRYIAKGRKRQHKIEVRLNDEEFYKMEENIAAMKTTRSDYLRKLIVGTRIKEKPSEEFFRLMLNFTRIGANLNQLAAKANSNETINVNELKDLRKEMLTLKKKIEDEYL